MLKYFVFLLISKICLGQWCPPAEKLLPCTCDDRFKIMYCIQIRDSFDIKGVFDRVGPLIPDSAVFNSLEIDDTSLIVLPENSIQTLKFASIDISNNPNLTYIHPNAFNTTYSVTKKLSLWSNYISNNSPNEHDIFKFFNNFKNIESIRFINNKLSSVPAKAFDLLPNLVELYLGSNIIKSIGADAFANLSSLKKLYLDSDDISSEGLLTDAFKSISKSISVDLTCNEYQLLDETHFKTLLDNANEISVGGHCCGLKGCVYKRLICDSRADWICKDAEKYKPKLYGFLCDSKYDNIWEYCNKHQVN